jgi:hypothetical protein
MNNQHAIEQALSRGHVWGLMSSGRYWRARRNGATQTWKTRPGEFRIPVKLGLKIYGQLTHNSQIGAPPLCDWTVSETDPNIKPKGKLYLEKATGATVYDPNFQQDK